MIRGLCALVLLAVALVKANRTPAAASLEIEWAAAGTTTTTTPTCQVVVEPGMWPGSPVREAELHWLKELGPEASPVFWQSWYVYPRTGVAELEPGRWDFSQITPLLQDMLAATTGRDLCLQFGTVPQWMMVGPTGSRRWDYGNAKWNDTIVWGYKDPVDLGPDGSAFSNITEVAEYFRNFVAFYTAGGFTDMRTGKRYDGHRFKIPWFEFGNEMEYHQTPEVFTAQSDAVTAAVAKVAPGTKFLGLGLSQDNYGTPHTNLSFFEYFLDPANHAADAPIADAIDYHFYASPTSRTDPASYVGMFPQADAFVELVGRIEVVRRRLSPKTKTFLKELGIIAHGDNKLDPPPLPDVFWSASGAYWAYLYAKLAKLQIDVASMSQLIGGNPRICTFPSNGTRCGGQGVQGCVCAGSNFPSVTMLDWQTGKPTARWFVLKMLVDAFGSRTKRVVPTTVGPSVGDCFVQAFEVTESDGAKAKKLLAVNKDKVSAKAPIAAGAAGFRCVIVTDGRDPWTAPVSKPIGPTGSFLLGPFAVAIFTQDVC